MSTDLVASSPTLLLVTQTSATSVIVEWSQPSGGATVTGYVVHYSDGVTNMTHSVPASSTSLRVTNLVPCHNYTLSVEASSKHLSGLSKKTALTLGKYPHSVAVLNTSCCYPGPPSLVNVTLEIITSTVISTQWDIPTPCSHFKTFRVKYAAEPNGTDHTFNKTIVAKAEAFISLVPFTNYSIQIAAVDELGGVGPYSYPVTVQTPENGKHKHFKKLIKIVV